MEEDQRGPRAIFVAPSEGIAPPPRRAGSNSPGVRGSLGPIGAGEAAGGTAAGKQAGSSHLLPTSVSVAASFNFSVPPFDAFSSCYC